MARGISRVMRNDFACTLVRSLRDDLVVTLGVKAIKYGEPTKKKLKRRFDYYTKITIGRKTLHVLNRYEREKVCKEFAALRKDAAKKNPDVVFFPVERVIRLLHKKGYNLVRHTLDMKRIKLNRVDQNLPFMLTFRKKNDFIRIMDDFNWKARAYRLPMFIWKAPLSDEVLANAEALVAFENQSPRPKDYFPQWMALYSKCIVQPTLLKRIEHRAIYIDPKNRNYFLKQINLIIPW